MTRSRGMGGGTWKGSEKKESSGAVAERGAGASVPKESMFLRLQKVKG